MLGICNGFQALIKLGLVPYGDIRDMTSDAPTLTFNNIGRHISQIVTTRVVSNKSPWFSLCEPGEEHAVAVSHGEGRFYAPESTIKELFANGQVATQYVNAQGVPTMNTPFNPNGSLYAIEGITSPTDVSSARWATASALLRACSAILRATRIRRFSCPA